MHERSTGLPATSLKFRQKSHNCCVERRVKEIRKLLVFFKLFEGGGMTVKLSRLRFVISVGGVRLFFPRRTAYRSELRFALHVWLDDVSF